MVSACNDLGELSVHLWACPSRQKLHCGCPIAMFHLKDWAFINMISPKWLVKIDRKPLWIFPWKCLPQNDPDPDLETKPSSNKYMGQKLRLWATQLSSSFEVSTDVNHPWYFGVHLPASHNEKSGLDTSRPPFPFGSPPIMVFPLNSFRMDAARSMTCRAPCRSGTIWDDHLASQLLCISLLWEDLLINMGKQGRTTVRGFINYKVIWTCIDRLYKYVYIYTYICI